MPELYLQQSIPKLWYCLFLLSKRSERFLHQSITSYFILHLVMQADELEGLHAEPELSGVGLRMHLNRLINSTPNSKTKKKM